MTMKSSSNKLVFSSHENNILRNWNELPENKNIPRAIGIVSEFNPFHKGHKYLIETAKSSLNADVVVSIMSGNFTQRGEPAVFNKWERARLAVNNGVDLVLQIPALCSCASADYFAKGSVDILEGLGAINYLAFGSESGDIGELYSVAEFLTYDEEKIGELISGFLKEGLSYPAARERAIKSLFNEDCGDILREPNNILAIEYLLNLDRMEPFTVKRAYGGHHESASEIRREMAASFGSSFAAMEDRYFQLVKYKVMSSSCKYLESLGSAGEGLGNKLKNEIRFASSRDELIERVKSKAFTYTRINRLLAQAVLGITKKDFNRFHPYVRVLGSSEKGRKYLKTLKKEESIRIPVVDNINKAVYEYPKLSRLIELDVLESDVYNLISGADSYENSDYVMHGFLGK